MGEPIEERMMAEWAAANLAPGTYSTHVRLGQPRGTPPGTFATAEERALKLLTLPEADLVVRTATGAEIVEFVVWRPQETVGQLLYYLTQLSTTPGWEDVGPAEIELKIVTGLEDSAFRGLAEALDIELEVFRPAWLEKALADRRGRR